MQFEKAQQLKKAWGNKPCDHPRTEKEYYLGSDTGDHVCLQCGRAIVDVNGKKIESEKGK